MTDVEIIVKTMYWLGCMLSFVSYAVRDMLLLRILTIVNCLLIIPYYFHMDANDPIWMAGIIVAINIFNVVALNRERQDPVLSDEESRLHKLVFNRMSKRNMLTILKVGDWLEAKAGTVLIDEGGENKSIILILEGEAEVSVNGKRVTTQSAGRFLGEITYVMDIKTASAKVTLLEPSRYLSFNFSALDQLKHDEPGAYEQFLAMLSVELANKVVLSAQGSGVIDEMLHELT